MSRSQPGADRQAATLEDAGHWTVVAPVLTIDATSARAPEGPFQIVIFLSEHAVRLGVPALADQGWLAAAGCYAVGGQTAAALAAAGHPARSPAQPTSEGLLALPELQALSGLAVLVVCGEGGRGVLGPALRQRGARVTRFECYRRCRVEELPPAVLDCNAIIAASGDGLRQVARLWLDAGGRPDVPVLVPSARVAALGVEVGLSSLHDCQGADSDAWLRGLAQLQSSGET